MPPWMEERHEAVAMQVGADSDSLAASQPARFGKLRRRGRHGALAVSFDASMVTVLSADRQGDRAGRRDEGIGGADLEQRGQGGGNGREVDRPVVGADVGDGAVREQRCDGGRCP